MSCDFVPGDFDRIAYSVTSDFNNMTAITVYAVCRPGQIGTFADLVSHWRFAAAQDKSWILAQHGNLGWLWEVAYDDSNNTDTELEAVAAPAASEWFIVIGRWVPTRIELDTIKLSDGTTGNSSSAIARTSISDALDTTGLMIGTQDELSNLFDGLISNIAIWDADLSDAEVVALQGRVHPLRIRPANIKFIVDLRTPSHINDYGPGHYSGTAGGSIAQDAHAPISLPFGFDVGWQRIPTGPAVGPAATNMWWLRERLEGRR